MLTILGWLWKNPNAEGPHYEARHANIWASMLDRNLTIPHRFVVVTDTPEADFDSRVKPVKLWDDWKDVRPNWGANRANCYRRLKAFSEEARELIGERFVSIDLDCVVLGNLDALFTRTEDFLILHRFLGNGARPKNWCQGSMWMMTAGARKEVWENFKGQKSANQTNGLLGTDQAWIAMTLPPTEAGWSHKDGVVCWYDMHSNFHRYKTEPPPVKLIFFNCDVDSKPDKLARPIRAGETVKFPWIGEHYRL